MKRIVLITTRDLYPYRTEILDAFEPVSGCDVYNECISSLGVLTSDDYTELEKKVQTGKDLNELIKKRTIGKLFKDNKANWTKNTDKSVGKTFIDYKNNGIPLLRRSFDSVVFYVLPCTGTIHFGDSERETRIRQVYTSMCIDLVSKCEDVERKDIYAIIHSRDTGIFGNEMESRVIKKREQVNGAPLEDISNAGHLYLFHHTAGHSIYDRIVVPVCSVIDWECSIKTVDEFFPKDIEGWWDKLSTLNGKSYVY